MAGELTHCSAGWGARDYDSSWASTSRLSTEAAAAAAAATAAAHVLDADLEGGAAGVSHVTICDPAMRQLLRASRRHGLPVQWVYSWQQAARGAQADVASMPSALHPSIAFN